MFRRGTKSATALVAPVLIAVVAGIAGAQEAGSPRSGSLDYPALEEDLRLREAALDDRFGELTEVGEQLEVAQIQLEAAGARATELEADIRALNAELEARREAADKLRVRSEERMRAAYKGESLEGALLLFEGLLGADEARRNVVLRAQTTRLLAGDQEHLRRSRETQRALKDTIRQLQQRKAEYKTSEGEQRARTEELERREAELEGAIGGLGAEKERIEARIARLRAAEMAGLFDRPPATGSKVKISAEAGEDEMNAEQEAGAEEEGGERSEGQGAGERTSEEDGDREPREQRPQEPREPQEEREQRARELEIAREDIVAEPVGPIPYERYLQLYRESAARYGFADDWYVLAAVGKVESNHGENMGPSSAGAMGPMQFLPSTWKGYGVDGDGDGAANIMDPEDAIPAAAAYLRAGGAPGDWYAALFTYNRAGWYVKEVLAVAEGYRRLYGDDTVGPYLTPEDPPPTAATPTPTPAATTPTPPAPVPTDEEPKPPEPARRQDVTPPRDEATSREEAPPWSVPPRGEDSEERTAPEEKTSPPRQQVSPPEETTAPAEVTELLDDGATTVED